MHIRGRTLLPSNAVPLQKILFDGTVTQIHPHTNTFILLTHPCRPSQLVSSGWRRMKRALLSTPEYYEYNDLNGFVSRPFRRDTCFFMPTCCTLSDHNNGNPTPIQEVGLAFAVVYRNKAPVSLWRSKSQLHLELALKKKKVQNLQQYF